MSRAIKILKSRRDLLLISLFWILLWAIPWGNLPSVQNNLYLAFLTDMTRLGIALGVFIVPGILLYFLLEDDLLLPLSGILPVGFSLSVMFIGVIGLMGRIMGLSFETVKILFVLTGLIELILLMLLKPNLMIHKQYFPGAFQDVIRNSPLLLALVLATLLTFHDKLFFIDDTTYLAYLTNWQHSSHLNFNNIVHKANAIEIGRFWLSMYPMGQALISKLSGVPGLLLLGNYLELFLVPLAVITSFWFACTLGISRKVAGLSTLIQISLYAWMIGDHWPVGTWFYQSMAEDKVSAVFLLAPVLFVFVLKFIQFPSKKNLILVFLSGISLTLTHPVILLLSCAIALGFTGFSWTIAKKTALPRLLQLILVFAIVMIPYLVIRLRDNLSTGYFPFNATSASTSFQIDRYARAIGDVFYGLNPEVLKFMDLPFPAGSISDLYQLFRLIPVSLALFGGFLALRKLKESPLYWYILSCVLLVLFATIPYTGWILGYFISAILIYRVSWFSPLGLASVVVLSSIADWRKFSSIAADTKKTHNYKQPGRIAILSLICFMFVIPILFYGIFPSVPNYFSLLDRHKQLARIGAYVDQVSADPVTIIALGYRDTQLLPGISAHATLISFREETEYNGHNFFLTIDEIRERINASNVIRSLDSTISLEARCYSLEKFDVKFIVAQSENVERYKGIIDKCDRDIEIVFTTKDLALFEIK